MMEKRDGDLGFGKKKIMSERPPKEKKGRNEETFPLTGAGRLKNETFDGKKTQPVRK